MFASGEPELPVHTLPLDGGRGVRPADVDARWKRRRDEEMKADRRQRQGPRRCRQQGIEPSKGHCRLIL